MELEYRYYLLAEFCFFMTNASIDEIIQEADKYNLEFRKNKGLEDIQKAYRRAKSPAIGHYRVELELDMFQLYIRDIFKSKAKNRR